MKKILLITRPLTPPWDEASKNFAYDLARNFDGGADLELHIMTVGTLDDISSSVVQHSIYTKNHFNLVQKLRALFFQWRNRNKFDIVHYMFTPTILNTFLANTFLRGDDAKTIQTVATLREDLHTDKKLESLLFADAVVTYSQYRVQKLESAFSHKNITTIYPGINLAKFQPGEKDSALMSQWNITQQDFVVTYPGEFVRLGATDLIIDAFLDLWKDPKNHTIKYLCACRIKNDADAQKKKEVIAKLEKVGHADKIIFTDTFGDMNTVYNLSDVVIFPVTDMAGKFDVPLAMIEPYACKKPVIASDMALFTEFSNPDINVIIPTGEQNALSEAIVDLRNNPQECKRLGDNAFTFAHQTFDIKTAVTSYQKLYEKL